MTATLQTPTELALPTALQSLAEMPSPEGRVLSAYLDTSPHRASRQALVLAFRDACRAQRADLLPVEVAAFDAAVAQADAYLSDTFVADHPGLAVFASGSPAYFFTVMLPDPPLDDVTWADQPEIGPLAAVLDEHERVAVVLFDAARTRLFSVYLGAIESEHHFQDDVPGKQATGGRRSLAQSNMARHREDHVRRHAERTVHALMDLLRRRSFGRLLLAGPDEALAVLRRDLPRPLRARLAGQLELELFASESDVLAATRKAAAAIEREAEEHLVAELLEEGQHVVIGLDSALDALDEGRVHLLVLAETFHAPGAQCTACDRLVTFEQRCPSCGLPTTPLPSLRDAIIRQARGQRASIEFVGGAADRWLQELGGIGAWTRF